MVRFKTWLQPLQNFDGVGNRGLVDVDFLEAPRQGMIFFEDSTVFGVRGRPDAFKLSVGQGRLEQIGGVHGAARGRASADQRMNFVDEQNGVRIVAQLFEYSLQALLEIAAILGPGQQGSHIKGVDIGFSQDFRNIVFDNPACQSFCNGRFSDASFANQQGIVLAPAA